MAATPGLDGESLRRLRGIKHIVVLMLENRSFDQMLGFLGKDGSVEGLRGLRGDEVNYDEEGDPYPVFEWGIEETSFHPPQDRSGKILDPCHGPDCVAEQLETFHGQTPGGYVKNFLSRRKDGRPIEVPERYRGLPMGHYGEKHLPVYAMLGREYAVCDAWHSSIPGDTWPNRLYSITGEEADPISKQPGFWGELMRRLRGLPALGQLANAPIYDLAAFTRQLRESQWRWYSHDPATLRGVDGAYRRFQASHRENFTFFDRKRISLLTEAAEAAIVDLHDSFLDDAAKGELRDVSWIDPNFIDLKVLDPNSNDDHPPSDVRAGQALVLETYEALVNSPNWDDTVLVVTYDEHGGFYDHVVPPPVPAGDPGRHRTLGVRVPALVIGPRVRPGACHTVFEHTSLIATILRRFAADPEGAIARMPRRVHGAPDLGALLQEQPRPEALDRERLQAGIDEARERLLDWRSETRRRRRARGGKPSAETDGGAGQKQHLLAWQEEFLGFALRMRQEGLPPGQP